MIHVLLVFIRNGLVLLDQGDQFFILYLDEDRAVLLQLIVVAALNNGVQGLQRDLVTDLLQVLVVIVLVR
jgi:hypothetical protein